jgi:TonB family protein
MNAPHRSLTVVSRAALAAAALVVVASTAAQADQVSPSMTLAIAGHQTQAFTLGYVPARIKDVAYADVPAMDALMGTAATTTVQVTIDDHGKLVNSAVESSSGEARLDRAALAAAGETTFSPALVAGVPTGGTYLLFVDLSPAK